MNVKTGENVLIGGFIVTGNDSKKILLRAIGPSLAAQGVSGVLADPILELHASDGSLIATNDDWQDTQKDEVAGTAAPPTQPQESAIVTTLLPGAYTVVMRGKNNSTGVGLIESYDLDAASDSELTNISTRGFVGIEGKVMIAGFIMGNESGNANLLIRALGPSLTALGVSAPLADPVPELHDENGAIVMTNDNWESSQEAEIESTGLPPANGLESAMLVTLRSGAYTAVVASKDGSAGVALVEVYRLLR